MGSHNLATHRSSQVSPVLGFLRCRTPDAWIDAALADLRTLLLDHASLELKAAQQAQKLIWRYGTGSSYAETITAEHRLKLLRKMSRLAREELRHFEQVVELLAARGVDYEPVAPSRYARTLHAEVRKTEPGRLVDTLLVGAIIEARSCERFYALLPALQSTAPDLAHFYASLLRSEARHFADYLLLAQCLSDSELGDRLDQLLRVDAALISASDTEMRFHSGRPA
jgi:tRNA 2-(methylsulfanyl)-N6-isopentenyladenosine37 hydroxylase